MQIFKCKYQLNAKSEIEINSPKGETRIGSQQREAKTFKLNLERGIGFNQGNSVPGRGKGTRKGPGVGMSLA